MVKSRLWESLVLLLIAFTLFRPGFWLDSIHDPFETIKPADLVETAGTMGRDEPIRVVVSGPDFDNPDKTLSTTLLLNMGEEGDGVERLKRAGLEVETDGDKVSVVEPLPGSPLFDKIGKSFDYYGDTPVTVSQALVHAERVPKEVMFIPALLLLGLIIWIQRRRRTPEDSLERKTQPA